MGGRLLFFKWMSGSGFWAGDIAAFAAVDRAHSPPNRPVVFVGSSSIRLSEHTEADMSPLPVLNSRIWWLSAFAGRVSTWIRR